MSVTPPKEDKGNGMTGSVEIDADPWKTRELNDQATGLMLAGIQKVVSGMYAARVYRHQALLS